jgi:hypothetical protein
MDTWKNGREKGAKLRSQMRKTFGSEESDIGWYKIKEEEIIKLCSEKVGSSLMNRKNVLQLIYY